MNVARRAPKVFQIRYALVWYVASELFFFLLFSQWVWSGIIWPRLQASHRCSIWIDSSLSHGSVLEFLDLEVSEKVIIMKARSRNLWMLSCYYLQRPYPTTVHTVATASVDPTAIGAVSSRYVPVALHWNVGPHKFDDLYMKLCIFNSRKYSFARCPDLSFSSYTIGRTFKIILNKQVP